MSQDIKAMEKKLQTLFRNVPRTSSALRVAAIETGHASIHLDDGLGGTLGAQLRIGREVASLVAGGFYRAGALFYFFILLCH